MKKRHEQKLIILSLVTFVILNFPFVFIFNNEGHLFGFPIFYLSVFCIWLAVVIVSYVVLKRFYE